MRAATPGSRQQQPQQCCQQGVLPQQAAEVDVAAGAWGSNKDQGLLQQGAQASCLDCLV
jgi:hypothetical protein